MKSKNFVSVTWKKLVHAVIYYEFRKNTSQASSQTFSEKDDKEAKCLLFRVTIFANFLMSNSMDNNIIKK